VIINQAISEEAQQNFQKAINRIELLIESVNASLNISNEAVAVFSSTTNNPIYQLIQITLSNSSQIYSSESNNANLTASISIDQSFINQLSYEDIYSFFFLPSSLFYYAQRNKRISIISPIVGAHIPKELSLLVNMSFADIPMNRPSGTYSCAFWEFDRWNNSGCNYSQHPITHYHQCHCDHLTSFALIFTPNGNVYQTFIPSIIAAFLSIISLFISLIIAIYHQTTPQATFTTRHFSIANICSLISLLILFILLTIILFKQYPSSIIGMQCQTSSLNLTLVTYFFLLLTFSTKTLLGLFYFFTIFVRFATARWTITPGKWFFASLLIVIIVAIIPTVVATALENKWTNVFIQYENICWFSSSYLIKFITIPISILVGINGIIFMLILIRLLQFVFCTTDIQAKDKRLKAAISVWIASCILLGIAWILGPVLGFIVDENGQTNSIVGQGIQWTFTLLIGLEGVGILIVNILFYLRVRQKRSYLPGRDAHTKEKKKTVEW
jgi:hypothetical protein